MPYRIEGNKIIINDISEADDTDLITNKMGIAFIILGGILFIIFFILIILTKFFITINLANVVPIGFIGLILFLSGIRCLYRSEIVIDRSEGTISISSGFGVFMRNRIYNLKKLNSITIIRREFSADVGGNGGGGG